MVTRVKQTLEAANAAAPRITPAQAREMIANGNSLVVDVRDAPEVEQTGKVAGAYTSRATCWNSEPIQNHPTMARILPRVRDMPRNTAYHCPKYCAHLAPSSYQGSDGS